MFSSMMQNVWNEKNSTYAALFLAIAGVAGAGWFGYSWYKRGQEQAAYKDLAESIEGYVKARNQGQRWADVERGFQSGAQRHSSSALQPYFLVYQADALIELGKQQEALAIMDKALGMIARTNPLYYLYALKRALIRIDMQEAAIQKQGREELHALAKDSSNPAQDMARYYAGVDALLHSDKEAGEKFLTDISQESGLWHQLAQDKLSAA